MGTMLKSACTILEMSEERGTEADEVLDISL
jgi:hypothetical protein